MIAIGSSLRDRTFWSLPNAPGALKVFQELASSREWVVSGPPRAAYRGLEYLHETKTVDPETGHVYRGMEQFLKRRVPDYLLIGRTAMYRKRSRKPIPDPIEYIDPARLVNLRHRTVVGFNRKRVPEVKPNEEVWNYAGYENFRHDEVVVDHPMPIGTHGFVAPVLSILPKAALAWLLREHDTASVDGRKLREIFLVSGSDLKTAIDEALLQQVALWSGANPEEVGVPIVEIDNVQGDITNKFGRLGISSIPEHFDRENFKNEYVNEISAAFGLSLRHFWNNERTTNKALEEVQERRQQLKGPNNFIRSEMRLINQSGFLDHFESKGRKIRFGILEETDASSMKDQAAVIDMYASALDKLATNFQGVVSLESFVAWFQSLGLLPNDLTLIEGGEEMQAMVESDPAGHNENEATVEDLPRPTTEPAADSEAKSAADLIKYGEILLNQNGDVLSVRQKVYHFPEVLAKANTYEETAVNAEDQAELVLKQAISAQESLNRSKFQQIFQNEKSLLVGYFGKVEEWMEAVNELQPLMESEQLAVDCFMRSVESSHGVLQPTA